MKVEIPSIVGYVDRIANGQVAGWVLDLGRRGRAIEVALRIDGQEVARQPTALERPDVAWKYGSHARAGFLFSLPSDRIVQQRFTLEVVEVDSGVALPLSGSALEPAAHGIQLGTAEVQQARLTRALHEQFRGDADALLRLNQDPTIRLTELDPELAEIWIVNGAERTASELFRTYALAQSLRRLGCTALVLRELDVPLLRPTRQRACVFVRVAWSDPVRELVQRLRAAQVTVVADFDDLVFRPSLIDRIDGVRFLGDDRREAYRQGMHRYRRMLEAADVVSVTTTSLAREAAEVAQHVVQLGNFPLQTAREAAHAALQAPRPAAGGGLQIGYYSGTLTHQADFAACARGLVAFLKAFPDAGLRIVGEFELAEFPELQALPNVQRAGLMGYAEMLRDMARCDVVLAPLQLGDPFCEAKSELKFFDAALVQVPIVASPTEPFRAVIRPGVNGFLASGEAEWFGVLQRLALEPQTRLRVAREAHDTVLGDYSAAAQDAAVQRLLDACRAAQRPAEPAASPLALRVPAPAVPLRLVEDRRRDLPRLVVLLPEIAPGSGGHRKVLTWCHRYARAGGTVTVLIQSRRSDAELRQVVDAYYFPDCGTVRAYDDLEPLADVAVATSWPTAHVVAGWTSVPKRCYFIQDFEPMFSPVNADYVQAYHSYRLGLEPVVFGDWNCQRLHREFGLEATPIRFPVDREVYQPPAAARREPIILFYARPSQPRRLYELGLAALRRLRAWLPDVRFVLFGEDIPGFRIDGFECIGRQTDLTVLADWYGRARLALCFSPTNPSAMTFEMLACGLPVVDVDLGPSGTDFEGCTALVRAEPTIEALTGQLYRLASDPSRCLELSREAVRWAERLPTDAEFADEVLGRLGLAPLPEARPGRQGRAA